MSLLKYTVFLFLSLFYTVFGSCDILVLVENTQIKDSHSIFLDALTSRGYNVITKRADDPTIVLKSFGKMLYCHLVLLSPSVVEFGGTLNVKEILNFVDDGGNVVVAASNNIGPAIRQLGSDFGVEFDEENSYVIDHLNYDSNDNGLHTRLVVPADNLVKSSVITGGKISAPLLYQGIGISADPNNPLIIDVLHGTRSSYSYNPNKRVSDYPNTIGSNTKLITAVQARNNARVLFIGSIDFFSNNFFESSVSVAGNNFKVSGNAALTDNLMRWVLGERGQLRYTSVKHHRVGESIPPSQYTIMDEITYAIKIETKNDDGMWVPYVADDVQMEFVRIDPFIRKRLENKNGEYNLTFTVPDVYGVFKFVVDYHRLGYTHLLSVIQVPVRPFTHLQYERFIPAAFPYYASAISMMVGVVLFSFVYLYQKDDKEKHE